MKTIIKLVKNTPFVLVFFMLITPLASFAQHVPTAAEEAEAAKQTAFIGEIAIAVLFIVSVTAFLVYKAKHDKKVREKQLEIMKKVQAAKKRAA
jgi:triosephosphate isomerase